MSAVALKELRKKTGLTEAQLAKRMGLTLATYQDLESGKQSFGQRHRLMLDGLALELAVEAGKSSLATSSARKVALSYAALFLRRQVRAASSRKPAAAG